MARVPAAGDGEPESLECWVRLSDQSLELSPQDDRKHRVIKLPNGLTAWLSSDPTHEKAAAALTVMVGAFADPPQLPGLAHFCEHMCFLGSEKYPEENAYKKYLSAHGGRSNASTSSERTVFQFDVAAEYFEHALDIFAQFFVAPLFTASATQREMEAVDSEDSKNRTNDGRRLLQVTRAVADPTHCYSKFSTGNLVTLRDDLPPGLCIREAVMLFHRRHYIASRMRLCACGRESLDELEQWIRAGFSDICSARNGPMDDGSSMASLQVAAGAAEADVAPQKLPALGVPFLSPFNQQTLPFFVQVAPLRELRQLQLSWSMPSMQDMYRTNPINLLSHLLGHEGEGSVFSVLQDRGWATSLSAGTSHEDAYFSLFSVKVVMTPEGEAQWPKIVAIIMQYCKLLKNLQPHEIQRHWAEKKAIAALAFRFQQKSVPYDFVQAVVRNMTTRATEHVLSGGYIFDDVDFEAYSILASRLTLENLMLRLISQSCDSAAFNAEEKWYKIPYSREPLPEQVVQECTSFSDIGPLSLPAENEFIPDDLSLCGTARQPLLDSPVTPPTLVQVDARGRLWHKLDERYAQPRVEIMFFLRSKAVHAELVPANVLDSYIRSRLKQSTYAAGLAGLSWSLGANLNGYVLNISGYSQRAPRLFRHVLETLLQGPWTHEQVEAQQLRFDAIRERIERAFRNFDLERPDSHASYWASMLLAPEAPLLSEKLQAVERLTLDGLKSFHCNFLNSHVFAECFVSGNMSVEGARQLFESAWTQLSNHNIKPPPAEENTEQPVAKLHRGVAYTLRGPVPNAKEENSGVKVYFQAGDLQSSQQAALRMVAQILREPCFNELRTQQQIGYIVASSNEVDYAGSVKIEGLSITIVSKKISAPDVLSRIDTFLAGFRATLEAATAPEVWSNHVEALTTKLLMPPKKLSEEASRHWQLIRRRALDWHWREELAGALRKLSCDEMLTFFDELIGETSRRRINSLTFGNGFPISDDHASEPADTMVSKVVQVPSDEFNEMRAILPHFHTMDYTTTT